MKSERTLIVGYPGRLARAFASRWPLALKAGRADFDIADRSATLQALGAMRPELVINCAGLADMARCEADPGLAWSVNVRGVRHLAEGCRAIGARLVHFSSDYALDPVNEYGWTKRASEGLADLTIRLKCYDASHWCWQALRERRPVRMLTHEYLNPISTQGAVALVERILSRGIRGVVAIGTRERLSFHQVGQTWARVLGAPPDLVQPVDRIESSAPRLAEMFLDPAPLEALGVSAPPLERDSLELLPCRK